MKIIKCIIILVLSILMLCGCSENKQSIEFHDKDIWAMNNLVLTVPNEYIFKDFDKNYTETGCIVTFYFEE